MIKSIYIGKLSSRTNVNIETIRYYEKIGILPRPMRTQGGNRQYSDDDVKRVIFIKRCRNLDYSIEEIRALLKLADDDNLSCNEIYDFTIEHLKSIELKIATLTKMQTTLKSMAKECSRGETPSCAIIDMMTDG
ncbi:MAG: helix-turn-helix domain-containing protein [Rhizobiales bacterium]|nr:helix-turn-helix domain-containing protein [Hyphomicrobiales bacterium]NRB12784.1 helix-turn-helix domain-containing protein [Hyphomicrobiales bacterium]